MLIYTLLFLVENGIFYAVNKKDHYTEQQKGNILGFKTAVTMTLIALYMHFGTKSHQLNVLTVSYFTAYLLADFVIGYNDYHSLMCGLSGYVHHIGYTLLNFVVCWTGNLEYFFTFFVEEFTSVLRNVGYIDSTLRTDYLFGFSFFILRILLHLFLIWKYRHNTLVFRGGLVIWGLHIYWFYTWYKKYMVVETPKD